MKIVVFFLVILAAFISACGSDNSSPNNPVPLSNEQGYSNIVPAQPGGTNGRIEVIEFFSYAERGSYSFETFLTPWVRNLPRDVSFRRMHVPWNHPYCFRLFCTLEVMGRLEQFHQAVFDQVRNGGAFYDDKAVFAWADKQGPALWNFREIWYSFRVQQNMTFYTEIITSDQAYNVSMIPSIAVNGRFMINFSDYYYGSRSESEILAAYLKTADELIAQIRSGK